MIFSPTKTDKQATSRVPDRIQLDPRAVNSFAFAITQVFDCVERDDQRARNKNRATR
jgi:hypothetical protein